MFAAMEAFLRDYCGAGLNATYSDERGRWSVDYLIQCSLDLPIIEKDIFDMEFLNRRPWRSQVPGMDRLTIGEILDHLKRIEKADIFFPVLLDPEGMILDGFHRVVKQFLSETPTVRCRQFVTMPKPDLLVKKPELWPEQTL